MFCFFQNFAVGIIVPDADVFISWAEKKGYKGDLSALCKNKVSFSALSWLTMLFIHCVIMSED